MQPQYKVAYQFAPWFFRNAALLAWSDVEVGSRRQAAQCAAGARQNHPLHVTMVREAMDQGEGLATLRAKTRILGLARLSGELLAARSAA